MFKLSVIRTFKPPISTHIRIRTMSGQSHHTRVAAGYKATLSNPRTSEAAKAHARSELQALEAYNTDAERAAHNHRVLGGFKATISNPNTSIEAKNHAQEILEAAGEYDDTIVMGGSKSEDEHMNRVLGGYKATLKNPNTSGQAKAHAAEVLNDA